VAAIRAGRTRVIGKRTPPKFFTGNTVQSICRIVKKGVRENGIDRLQWMLFGFHRRGPQFWGVPVPPHPAQRHRNRSGPTREEPAPPELIEVIAPEELRPDLELKDSESFRIENRDSNI
jgi:hypothetical protein